MQSKIDKKAIEAAIQTVEAIEDGDLARVANSGSNKIKNRATYQQALAENLPPEKLATIQRKQVEASKKDKIMWPLMIEKDGISRVFSAKDAEEICEQEGWKLIYTGKTKDTPTTRFHSLVLKENWDVVDKGLDKVYKLGGLYAKEQVNHIHTVRPLEDMSNDELDKYIIQHSVRPPVKLEDQVPNVIESHKQADIVDGEIVK